MERVPVGGDSVELLADVPLLAGLPRQMLARLGAASEQVRVDAGEVLCHQGDPGEELFVVRSGRLRVTRTGDGGDQLDITLGRGAILGEMALLTGSTRTATVTAVRDSELLAVGRAGFEALLDDGSFALALTRSLAERLHTTASPAATRGQRVSVVSVAATSAGLPVRGVAGTFTTALPRSWKVAVLDPPEPGSDDVAAWADRVERAEHEHDVVCLVSDRPYQSSGADAWMAFALRQADRVFMLTRPGDEPPAVDLGWDVGLVAPTPTVADFDPWRRRCRAHHWLRSRTFSADAARAVRRITGTSVGLVLSGGGARALAHIGVIAVLRELGIPIDRVGGTSVGSVVAAVAAGDRSVEEVLDVCRSALVQGRPFADYTVPRQALIRGRRARAMLADVFGDLRAEELPISWFGVTCDLLAGEAVVHRRGPVRRIVAASMSLPGLAPPTWFLGRLLVDGGVVNNLPVDAMLDDGEGDVIAVDVMREWSTAFGATPPPGQRRRVPNIVETLAATSALTGRQSALETRRLAQLLITPDLRRVNLLDWRAHEAIVAAGRSAAEAALAGAGRLPPSIAAVTGRRVSSH